MKQVTRIDFQRDVHQRLPPVAQNVCTCILHHQHKTERSGEHWLTVYRHHNQTAVYFDSFGLSPDQITIIKFMKKHTVKWFYSMKMLQNSLTVVCGEYCVVFLLHYHHFKCLRRFLHLFNCDLLENDRQVFNFVKKSYHLNLSLFFTEL